MRGTLARGELAVRCGRDSRAARRVARDIPARRSPHRPAARRVARGPTAACGCRSVGRRTLTAQTTTPAMVMATITIVAMLNASPTGHVVAVHHGPRLNRHQAGHISAHADRSGGIPASAAIAGPQNGTASPSASSSTRRTQLAAAVLTHHDAASDRGGSGLGSLAARSAARAARGGRACEPMRSAFTLVRVRLSERASPAGSTAASERNGVPTGGRLARPGWRRSRGARPR